MNAGPDEDQYVAYKWGLAEIARMNRTDDETADLHRRLASQRVRHILNKLVTR